MGRVKMAGPRVAVVIPWYYPVFGGAENQCRLLNRQVLASGQADIPFVVTKRITKESKSEELVDGIPVQRLGSGGRGRWSGYRFYFEAFWFLFKHRNDYDVLHCHATSIIGFMMSVLGRITGKPVLLKLSTNGELLRKADVTKERDTVPRRLVLATHRLLAAYTVRHAHVIALNREGLEELELSGARHPYLIPNGVDVAAWRSLSAAERTRARSRRNFADDDVVFVYTGRFVRRKGIDTLLEGYRLFSERPATDGAAVHLCLVGDDPIQQDDATKQLLATFRNGTARNLHVFKSSDNVSELLQLADAYVLASYNEGLPNAVLEALAVGLPCVLSDIPPHVELLNQHPDQDHYLFETGRPASLAVALEKCYRRLRQKKGASTVCLNERYAINTVARQYIQLYESVIGNYGHPGHR